MLVVLHGMARARRPAISPAEQPLLPVALLIGTDVSAEDAAAALQQLATRKNTRDAYQRCWDHFLGFCDARGYKPMPASPIVVAEYFGHVFRVERRAFKTLKVHRAAIRNRHLQQRFADPSNFEPVPATWSGIIKAAEHSHVEQMKKRGEEPITLAVLQRHIERVIDRIDDDLKAAGGTRAPLATRLQALRDKAVVLLTSSSGCLSTNELASVRAFAWGEGDRSIQVHVNKSPRSDRVDGRIARIRYGHSARYCPVRTLIEWLQTADIPENAPAICAIDQYGHIGRTPLAPQNLRDIVKRRCGLAGVDPQNITIRGMRLGAMLQAAYDGQDDSEIIEAAGLSEQSLPKIKRLFDKARGLREAPATLAVERDPIDNDAPPRRRKRRVRYEAL